MKVLSGDHLGSSCSMGLSGIHCRLDAMGDANTLPKALRRAFDGVSEIAAEMGGMCSPIFAAYRTLPNPICSSEMGLRRAIARYSSEDHDVCMCIWGGGQIVNVSSRCDHITRRSFDVGHGDVLLMLGDDFQHAWYHSLQPLPTREHAQPPFDGTILLIFRVLREEKRRRSTL